MASHLKVHAAVKPYLCSDCGKSFTHLHTLHIHERVVVRPHVCFDCGKSFTISGQLNTDQRIHTLERDLTCDSSALKK